jgi:HPt (histidine-containing phosphotransfer) domain-containing protein
LSLKGATINLISLINNTKKSFDLEDSAICKLYRSAIDVSKVSTKEIKDGFNSSDYKKIENAAHTLKGATGSIKLDEIYYISKKLEDFAKESKDYDYAKDAEHIKDYFKKLKKELDKVEL